MRDNEIMLSDWRAMRDIRLADPLAAFDAWNEPWLGAAAAHDRFLAVELSPNSGSRDDAIPIARRQLRSGERDVQIA